MDILYATLNGISNLLLGGFGLLLAGLGIIFFIILPAPILLFLGYWILSGVDEMTGFLKGLDGRESSHRLEEDEEIELLNILEGRLGEDEMMNVWNILQGWNRKRPKRRPKIWEEPFGRLVGVFFLGCYLCTLFSTMYWLR
jgi:hypothetical protein